MFTEILNSFLNVRNKVKNADGEWVDMKQNEEVIISNAVTGTLSNTNQNILIAENWDGYYIIDSIQYTAQEPVQPRLWVNQRQTAYVDQIFHANPPFGSTWNGAGALYIDEYGHDYFEVVGKVEGEGNNYNRYTMALKKPIILPQGFKLEFGYLGSLIRDDMEMLDFGVKIVYRKIG